jgi:hypothetical protein
MGGGGGVLGGFAHILLSGVLGVARKSIVIPYFHVLLHFYDQGFQNVTPLPCVHLCVKDSLKTQEPSVIVSGRVGMIELFKIESKKEY